MKSTIYALSFISLLSLANCNNKDKGPIAKRVVILGLDGISVDGYNTAKTPNLDMLFTDGVLSLTTRNVMPSVTLPNWTSHLTGSGPEQHGVLSNGWEKEKIVLPGVDKDEDGYYPSIFKVLKEEVPTAKTAFYYNWKSLINSMNPRYFDESSYEDNDEYLSNYSKAFDFIKNNEKNPSLIFFQNRPSKFY